MVFPMERAAQMVHRSGQVYGRVRLRSSMVSSEAGSAQEPNDWVESDAAWWVETLGLLSCAERRRHQL